VSCISCFGHLSFSAPFACFRAFFALQVLIQDFNSSNRRTEHVDGSSFDFFSAEVTVFACVNSHSRMISIDITVDIGFQPEISIMLCKTHRLCVSHGHLTCLIDLGGIYCKIIGLYGDDSAQDLVTTRAFDKGRNNL
jgi:hypothetical protein